MIEHEVSGPYEVSKENQKFSDTVEKSVVIEENVSLNVDCLNDALKIDIDKDQKCVSVKGRLKRNIQFWFDIKANDQILDTIENGYKLPFKQFPDSVHLKNNKSSLENDEFVKEAITDLLKSGSIMESQVKPFVINPLTVAQNSTKNV